MDLRSGTMSRLGTRTLKRSQSKIRENGGSHALKKTGTQPLDMISTSRVLHGELPPKMGQNLEIDMLPNICARGTRATARMLRSAP